VDSSLGSQETSLAESEPEAEEGDSDAVVDLKAMTEDRKAVVDGMAPDWAWDGSEVRAMNYCALVSEVVGMAAADSLG
jgi:hypothetical protein